MEEALLIYNLCKMWNLSPSQLMEEDARILAWSELIGLANSDGK